MNCSVIIATLDRVDSLRAVLQCLSRQTVVPAETIIAASGDSSAVERLVREMKSILPVRTIPCVEKSAARQRNFAAASAAGEIFAFLDDDIEFGEDLFARVLAHFATTGPASPAAGFTDITRAAHGAGADPQLLIDHADRAGESLYVEAVKGRTPLPPRFPE